MKVDGKQVVWRAETRWKSRWRRVQRWLCVFAFMRREYTVYVADVAPSKGSHVTIMYETEADDG